MTHLRSWIFAGIALPFALLSVGCGSDDDDGGSSGPVKLGKEVHVVPTSKDSRPDGTVAHPFATLQAALSEIGKDATWDGTIIAHEGRYTVAEDTALPKKADFKVEAGATFALGSLAGIHTQRDVKMLGTEAKPITFTWLQQGSMWGSVTNFEPTSKDNVFEYVVFEHGGHSEWGETEVRGALSLEKASGRISHCTFRENEGDDGLSLGTSATKVEYSDFEANFGDAMDIDGAPPSGRTEVANCTFHDNVNDAIDLGEGTTVLVHHNNIYTSGDKGVSIGETSFPTVEHNLIVGCNIGVAFKDGSKPVVQNNTLYKNNYGISAYEAKGGLGVGKGVFTNGIIWASEIADVDIDTTVEDITQVTYTCLGNSINSLQGIETPTDGFDGEGNISPGAGCDDPMFVDPDADDFHLTSEAGHYDPIGKKWVTDDATSPAIDAGDPKSEVGDEPEPNGSVINLGRYGGTEEASKSVE